MKLTRYLLVFASAFVLWFAVEASSTVSSQPALSTSTNAANFDQARDEAFQSLLSGNFDRGAELIKSLESIRSDETLEHTGALTKDYMAVRARTGVERQKDLSAAIRRVRLAKVAQGYRSELVKDGLADKLWDRLKAVAEDIASADESLSLDSTSQPADAQKKVLGYLDHLTGELTAACALVTGRQGPWHEAFRGSAEGLVTAVADYRKIWTSTEALDGDVEDAVNRWRTIKVASEKLHDALIDMGVLISKEPLTSALNNAREAKVLSEDSEAFIKQEWVRDLVSQADEHGKELVSEGKWIEALMIYGRDGLSGIDENNVDFKDMVKKASRHVRVGNIYGLRKADTSKTPATDESTSAPTTLPAEAEPLWRKMIVGIDTAMVREAIERIDGEYVVEPDYKKIGLSALDAVRVLVESPRAAETLVALKDEQKRTAFLEGVDQQIKKIKEAENAVDYLHVIEALNAVIDLNSKTLDLPAEVLDMEFAEGMTDAMDKFTAMIWPFQEEAFRKQTMGSFFGIGVQIRKDTGGFVEVVTPLADSPALRAGIRAGDDITHVNGQETRMMTVDDVVGLITGPRGTSVTLTIRRTGKSEPFNVDVFRDTIRIQTIKGWRRMPDGKWDFLLDADERIGYIRLTQFTMDTAAELRQVILSLRRGRQPVRGLIIDMRFNPGGLLSSAEDVSDEFLSHGTVVSIKGRTNQSQKTATALGAYQRGEVIVLVNQYSASAAEIVSGALKDWARATIVGERTYGKGSVQRPMSLKSTRAQLKLTTAYYYLPSGRCLHRTNGVETWGVDPDIAVSGTVRQMNRWSEIRQETDLLKKFDAKRLNALLSEQLNEDIQLQTALFIMRLKLLAGDQPARQAKAA